MEYFSLSNNENDIDIGVTKVARNPKAVYVCINGDIGEVIRELA